MKLLLTLILFLILRIGQGQNKPDTLFISNKKYLLHKTKIFHTGRQHGPVILPSEYKNLKFSNWNDVLQFKFKAFSDSICGIENDDEGNEIMTLIWELNCDTIKEKTYYLSSFVDTLSIKESELGKLKPFIKAGNRKIYFCAARVDAVLNDSITKYSYFLMHEGNIFSYWDSSSWLKDIELKTRKSTLYILRDLYYRKGNATFYLDRQFVIKLK